MCRLAGRRARRIPPMPAMRRFSRDVNIRRKSPGSGLNRSANAGITSREASVAGQEDGPDGTPLTGGVCGTRSTGDCARASGATRDRSSAAARARSKEKAFRFICRLYEGGAGGGCDKGVTAKQHLFDEQGASLAGSDRDTIFVTFMALRGAGGVSAGRPDKPWPRRQERYPASIRPWKKSRSTRRACCSSAPRRCSCSCLITAARMAMSMALPRMAFSTTAERRLR